LVERVRTGIDGLDEVIEGGFPKGSLILLAGNPGTGKTVFSAQFLAKGAGLGEPGIYVSFAESREALIENLSRHLGLDFERLEVEGKFKFLDYTAVKEEAVSAFLEAILSEVKALGAKRLVIDSFSAMAQAFKEPIDVRIIVNIVLGRIVRQMGCTTIMVEEVSIGESKIGFGMEEFVADGVIVLRIGELDGRLFRDLELVKLRGTAFKERRLAYTLKGGFKVFPPFKPKPIMEPRRFQPVPDPPGMYSTGSKDLDEALGGGVSRGSTMLLEVDEKASTLEYHLFVVPMATNFALQGRGVVIVPSSGVDPAMMHKYVDVYGGTEEEFRRYVTMIVAKGLIPPKDLPNVIAVNGEDWRGDFDKVIKMGEKLSAETGQPNLSIVGTDTVITLYGEERCEEILNLGATDARRVGAAVMALVKAGRRDLAIKLSPIADVYLRLAREHGCLLLYGIKPRTCLYAVEMDVSRGYPLPRLTPMV